MNRHFKTKSFIDLFDGVKYSLLYIIVTIIYFIFALLHALFIPLKLIRRYLSIRMVEHELLKFDAALDGRVFVVTGCSNGIGYSLAEQLLQRNAKVLGLDIDETGARALKNIYSDKFYFVQCNLSDASSISSAVKLIKQYSPTGIDALYNIAGVGYSPNMKYTEDGTSMVIYINAIAPFLLSIALAEFLEKRSGRVVYASSSSASWRRSLRIDNYKFDRPLEGVLSFLSSSAAYARSKELVNLIVEEQNHELKKRNIRVFGNDPGIVDTQLANGFGSLLFVPFGFDKSQFPHCMCFSELTRSIGAKTPAQAAMSFLLLGFVNEYEYLSGCRIIDYEKAITRSRISNHSERNEIYKRLQKTFRLDYID